MLKLSERQISLLEKIPKAENHIHIEGSIPWELAIRLSEKNHIKLPHYTTEGIRRFVMQEISSNGLNGFMKCDRLLNSVCVEEEDYEEVVMALAREDKRQNIIYQELHLDYPLNEERGIPLEIVMAGYGRAKERALKELGVEIVYIAGLDRTLPEEKCYNFVSALEPYLDIVAGLGMDCEEIGHPCIEHLGSYQLAGDMGLFLTAHAGEEGPLQNMWDALLKLRCRRIDHGCKAAESPEMMEYLKENDILLAMCPYSNTMTFAADDDLSKSPLKTLLRNNVPVSISSDDPPYTVSLTEELMLDMEKMELTEDDMIRIIRNGFAYSISGSHLLSTFDQWVFDFRNAMKEKNGDN